MKFVDTLLEDVDFTRTDMEYFFAGTLWTPMNDMNVKHAKLFRDIIEKNPLFQLSSAIPNTDHAAQRTKILKRFKYSLSEVVKGFILNLDKRDIDM